MTQPDPEELRRLGHEVVDLLTDYLVGVEDRALFPDIEPARLDELFDEPVPEEPMPAEDVLREVREKLLAHSTAVNHPGYLGLITSTPTPIGILGDFIASALNQNIGAYSIGPSGVAMELRTVRWLADLAGYDDRAGGNLTSGGMMANFIGLKLARDWASGDRAQHDGVRDDFTVYTSEERHVSVDKAVDAVGCGRNGLRVLPTDDAFSLRIEALEAAGREVVAWPAYTVVPNPDLAWPGGWQAERARVLFTAPSAVAAFVASGLNWPGSCWAIGATTATALRNAGVDNVKCAQEPTAAGIEQMWHEEVSGEQLAGTSG